MILVVLKYKTNTVVGKLNSRRIKEKNEGKALESRL